MTAVPDAAAATVLLVLAEERDGAGLYAVDPASDGVTVTARPHVDQTRKLFDVDLRRRQRTAARLRVGGCDLRPRRRCDDRQRRRCPRCRDRGDEPRHRIREGAQAVRPADRKLPGRPASVRRHVRGGRAGPQWRHPRAVGRRFGRARRAPSCRGARQGVRGAAGLRRRHRDPGVRRYRLHLGARRPPLSQAASRLERIPRRTRSVSRGGRRATRQRSDRKVLQ